jgi:hypothetical protein
MIELMASMLRNLRALTATDFAAAGSPQGRAWLAAVPSVLHDLAALWHLTIADDWSGTDTAPWSSWPTTMGGRWRSS